MAEAGSLIHLTYQYEFNGLLFGSGTSFQTVSVNHLSLPSVRSSDLDLEGDHGTAPGTATYGTKIIDITMNVLGNPGSDIEGKLAQVRQAFQLPRRKLNRVMTPFVWLRPGEPMKMMFARCHKREIPSDYDTAHGRCEVNIQLVAYDPVIYSVPLLSQSITLAPGVGTATMTIENSGDFPDGYAPVVVLKDDWDDWSVTNEDDGYRVISGTNALLVGDILEIDMKGMWVKKNALQISWTTFNLVTNWWDVLPGANHITFQRSLVGTAGDASATAEVFWRHTWI